MLKHLRLNNVGPATKLELEFSPRLNLVTGDNGLGKSFLLDIAWWAMTRRWPAEVNPRLASGRCALPLGDGTASIGFYKYLWLESINFSHDEPAIRAALAAGQALSYRLHRGPKYWRLLVSFKREAAPVVTRPAVWGCVGVDFNADHLAIAQTDPCGNIMETWRKDLDFADKSSGQRQALMQDALHEIVLYAKACQKPLVIEALDFQAKKQQMGRMSKAKRRMLSDLASVRGQSCVPPAFLGSGW